MTEPMKYVPLNDRDKAITADYVDHHITSDDIHNLYDASEQGLFYANLRDQYMGHLFNGGSANLNYEIPVHEPGHYDNLDSRRFQPIVQRAGVSERQPQPSETKRVQTALPEPTVSSRRRGGSNTSSQPSAVVRFARRLGRFFR